MSRKTKLISLTFLLILTGLALSIFNDSIRAAFVIGKKAVTAGDANVNTLNQGLVGYWPFDNIDTTGTTIRDKSGNGFNGTLASGGTQSIVDGGVIGQATSFNPTDDLEDATDAFLVSHNATLLPTTNGLSVAFWMKSTDGNFCLINKGGGSSNGNCFVGQQYNLGILSSQLYWTVRNTDSTAFRIANYSAGTIINGAWHYVAATAAIGSNSAMKLYVDGALAATGDTPTGTFDQTQTSALAFGSGGFYKYTGQLDEMRIYNRELSADEVKRLYNIRPAVQAKPALSQGLVGYWSFDEDAGTTVPDHSGQGNTGTATNGPVGATGQLGRAFNFDGTDDYVNWGNNPAYDFERTDPFSAFAWIYADTWPGSPPHIIGKIRFDSPYTGWNIDYSSGAIRVSLVNSVSTNNYMVITGGAITTGAWHYVGFTYTGSSAASGVIIYVDGSPRTPTVETNTLTSSMKNSFNFQVGARDLAHNPFDGLIDDVRIYNRALSADEIKRLYNIRPSKISSSPTNRLTSGLVGYWTLDGGDINWATGQATDKSGSGNNGGLINMSTSTTPAMGKHGQALQFDGVDDYIQTNDHATLDLTRWTISAWINPNVNNANNQDIVLKGGDAGGNDNTNNYRFSLQNSGKLLGRLGSGTSVSDVTSNATISTRTWTYVTYVYDGTNEILYINGAQDISEVASITPATQNEKLIIGHYFYGGDPQYGRFNGSLDDVRVYNRALSASEVQQLYNAGR